ncbi:GNAT family N-acetyltransferase [Nocardiopsis deserti]|uniref:GNAT family N-acetyltransferase n=1 Tax=Nocardiopsis deserti TaxID=2605988 RepID=UPI00123A4E7D|nr:GNAT family N-acetyltransferase [Nocardiopsis deserti]
MDIEIRLFREPDREAVVALALRAWEPVHASLRRVLGEEVYPVLVPDWRRSQHDEVAGSVDADHQGRGVGTALTEAATDWIREQGAAVAMVETGGDDGHAPARATYERAGYTALPIVRYFRKL